MIAAGMIPRRRGCSDTTMRRLIAISTMQGRGPAIPEDIHQHAMKDEHRHNECLALQWCQGSKVVHSQPVQQAAQKARASSKGGLGNLSWPCKGPLAFTITL